MKDEILIFHINLKFFFGISKKRNNRWLLASSTHRPLPRSVGRLLIGPSSQVQVWRCPLTYLRKWYTRNGEKNEKILLIQSHLLYWMKHDGLHISNVSYSTTFLTKEIRLISCNFYCVMLQVIYYNFDKFIDSSFSSSSSSYFLAEVWYGRNLKI